jgi:glycosyltransferase involved in cell wall biosynthesis
MIASLPPKVSVVLPYFNAEKTLNRAIKSITNQSFTDFELLLINNNSTDNSYSIATQFAKQDPRIKLIDEARQGVSFAANAGNREARGQYIARMDADDFSHRSRLEKQVYFLDNHPQIGV